MAKELVPEQELCSGRYVVGRVQSFSDEGGLYSVKRPEDKTRWALKEIIPPASMPDEELWERREKLREAVELLTRFEMPNLSRVVEHFSEGRRQYVVMEWVDGITLEKLLEMSVKPQPEELVTQWGIDLSEAIHYMHDRPQPFLFHVLELGHIMFNPEDNRLKLINYGLERFIIDGGDDSGAHATAAAAEIAQLARVMVLLLTKKEPGPFGLGQADPVSSKLAQVVNRALSGDPRKGFNNFEDVRVALDRVLHPPVQEVVAPRRYFFSRWIRWDLHLSRLWEGFLWRFFRQPLWVIVVELAALLVAAVIVYGMTHRPIVPRQGRAVYVACGSELYVLKGDRSLLTRIPMNFPVDQLLATRDGQRIYASVPGGNQLLVLNSLSNHLIGYAPVDKGPGALALDRTGTMMTVLHPLSGSLALLLLDPTREALEGADKMVRTRDRVIGMVPVGPQCQGALVYDPDYAANSTEVREISLLATSTEQSLLGKWVFDSGQLEQIGKGEASQLVLEATGQLAEPGAGVLADGGKRALLASATRLVPIEVEALTTGRGVSLEGSRPRQVQLSPDGKECWVLMGSGQLNLYSYPGLDFRTAVKLDGTPTAMCFVGKGDNLELWVTTDEGQVHVVSPSGRRVNYTVGVGPHPTSLVVAE